MSTLMVYALVAETPRGALPEGLAGEPLRAIHMGSLCAVVGSMASIPSPTAAVMAHHDMVVQRLAQDVDAILPLRFGAATDDELALAAFLGERLAELHEALALVAGREQMTLTVYGDPIPDAPSTAVQAPLLPLERFATQRWLARASANAVPEIAELQASLEPVLRAERVEHHVVPPLLASVFHLIDRGDAQRYLRAVGAALGQLGPVRVEPVGPGAPYAFAPDTRGLLRT